jgi:glycolate oxidase FAD binding subunit
VEFTVQPASAEDAAGVLAFASSKGLRVLFWGGGTHQGIGYQVDPDIVLGTARLDSVVEWLIEDLTVVVQPGVVVSDLEAQLQQRNQTALLPEVPGSGTVGGAVAAGLSGWRRLRYGPTRDRMLGVQLATGDGRVVRGGGRLVKNVTGYDLPRLVAGSLGSLGLISEVCLKLWPIPAVQATVSVDEANSALAAVYRPLALIETPSGASLYLAGTEEEVEAQATAVGGQIREGHRWPQPLVGSNEMVLRVPSSRLSHHVGKLSKLGVDYQAAHGVGEVRFVADGLDVDQLHDLRTGAESVGGSLSVVAGGDFTDLDPWGTPPDSVGLQRRVKAAFDPRNVANPGILPGGI